MMLTNTRYKELYIPIAVPLAIASLGVYDYADGSPPTGFLALPDRVGLGVFVTGCLLVTLISSSLLLDLWTPSRANARAAVVFAGLLTISCSDPTYASLILTIPLVDIRRRDDEPIRSGLTVLLVAVVAAALLFENTQRASNDLEIAVGLGIALLVVVLLGDALRSVDQNAMLETKVARLSERNRLAEELHDSLGHHLLAASIQLGKARAFRESDAEMAQTSIDFAAGAVAEAISETRFIVDSTRQSNKTAIEPAINDLVRRIVPTGTNMTLDISGSYDGVNTRSRIAIYRVVQEALTNLVRHSEATESTITVVATDHDIALSVEDNGIGFEADAKQLTTKGLGNMSHRIEELGGVLDISSSFKGTIVSAKVPK